LARYINSDYLDIKVNELPSGWNARIRVRISDGINTTLALSDPFTVEPKAPQALILQPRSGELVDQHIPLELIGAGSDLDEELPDKAFVWTSDWSGPIGTGRRLVTSTLAPGRHRLTLTVTNGRGLRSQASVGITIQKNP
jgi:hypothetical protein